MGEKLKVQTGEKRSLEERVDFEAGGMYVIPDEEAERADLRVCSTERYFSNDIEGVCQVEGCDRAIFFRPYGPMHIKRVCIHCAMLMTQEPQA
ncbi:MAG: hypothetical protein M3Y56_12060 [Armatimonadota bacterium]|nr:hypothetical protein [Armatimonadota bacterium]